MPWSEGLKHCHIYEQKPEPSNDCWKNSWEDQDVAKGLLRWVSYQMEESTCSPGLKLTNLWPQSICKSFCWRKVYVGCSRCLILPFVAIPLQLFWGSQSKAYNRFWLFNVWNMKLELRSKAQGAVLPLKSLEHFFKKNLITANSVWLQMIFVERYINCTFSTFDETLICYKMGCQSAKGKRSQDNCLHLLPASSSLPGHELSRQPGYQLSPANPTLTADPRIGSFQ